MLLGTIFDTLPCESERRTLDPAPKSHSVEDHGRCIKHSMSTAKVGGGAGCK